MIPKIFPLVTTALLVVFQKQQATLSMDITILVHQLWVQPL